MVRTKGSDSGKKDSRDSQKLPSKGSKPLNKPRKTRPKVQDRLPPEQPSRSQGVVIAESQQKRPKVASPTSKELVVSVPTEHLASTSTEKTEEDLERKITKIVTQLVDQTLHAPTKSRYGGASTSNQKAKCNVPPELEDELLGPPPGFNSETLEPNDKSRYDDDFAHRSFCPVVYLDLQHIKDTLALDLYPWFQYYEPWLTIKTSYSPSVVRHFYCNLEVVEVCDEVGELIEERLESTVRGQNIQLSAALINTYLGIDNPPTGPVKEFSDVEICQILNPIGGSKTLTFKPSSLSDVHRIVWYIYSRSMVNKSNNFTHFVGQDYQLMASIVSKEQRNIGQHIYNEINRYRKSSTRSTPLPFPQLISHFLTLHNIWYLEPNEQIVRIPRFDSIHLSRMNIKLPVGASTSITTKKRKEMESERPKVDEGQSSRAGSPGPPFMAATIQTYIQDALKTTTDHIKVSNAYLVEMVDHQVKRLVIGINENFERLFQMQDAHTQQLREFNHRLDTYEAVLREHFNFPPSDMPSQCNAAPVPCGPESTTPANLVTQNAPCAPTSSNVMLTPPDPATLSKVPIPQDPQAIPQSSCEPSGTTPIEDPINVTCSGSHDQTSAPIEPATAVTPYTPPCCTTETDPIPPVAPLRKPPSSSATLELCTTFTLPDDDNKGET